MDLLILRRMKPFVVEGAFVRWAVPYLPILALGSSHLTNQVTPALPVLARPCPEFTHHASPSLPRLVLTRLTPLCPTAPRLPYLGSADVTESGLTAPSRVTPAEPHRCWQNSASASPASPAMPRSFNRLQLLVVFVRVRRCPSRGRKNFCCHAGLLRCRLADRRG